MDRSRQETALDAKHDLNDKKAHGEGERPGMKVVWSSSGRFSGCFLQVPLKVKPDRLFSEHAELLNSSYFFSAGRVHSYLQNVDISQ